MILISSSASARP